MMYSTLSHQLQSMQFLDRTYKGAGQFYHYQTIKCSTCFFPHRLQNYCLQFSLPGQKITPHLQAQKIFKFEICLLLHFHSTFSKPTHFSTNQESWITVNTTRPILNAMLNPPLSQKASKDIWAESAWRTTDLPMSSSWTQRKSPGRDMVPHQYV